MIFDTLFTVSVFIQTYSVIKYLSYLKLIQIKSDSCDLESVINPTGAQNVSYLGLSDRDICSKSYAIGTSNPH